MNTRNKIIGQTLIKSVKTTKKTFLTVSDSMYDR